MKHLIWPILREAPPNLSTSPLSLDQCAVTAEERSERAYNMDMYSS